VEYNENVDKLFGKLKGIGKEDFGKVATDIFKFPKIFSDMLFTRIEKK